MKRYSHSVSCNYFSLMTWYRIFFLALHIWLCILHVFGHMLLLGTVPLPHHCFFTSRGTVSVPPHSLNSSSLCRDHPSLLPCVAGADGRGISAVRLQGRPDKDWREAFAEGSLQLCLAFLTAKKFPTKSCPLQSTLQDSSLSGLSRIAKHVLECLLCVSRCCTQVQCSLFNLPLASLRGIHHLPLLMLVLFFPPMSREGIKFLILWKHVFIFLFQKNRENNTETGPFTVLIRNLMLFLRMIAPEKI